MTTHTQKLGEALQAAREGRRPRLTQPEAAEKLGVSRTTIQNIEAGRFNKITPTIRGYARLLGWPDGAVDQGNVDVGADPEPQDPAEPPAASLQQSGLPPAVQYELQTNETLDSTVITLGPDEEDGQVIVVLQGRKGATPEEVARIAARYRKVRRTLQGLAADDDDGVADAD
jgi:DNA-binding XRE family transcriptional regulator